MPNWVVNKLQVIGDNTENILKNHIKKEIHNTYTEDVFDFDTIYKMPDSLNMIEGGIQQEAITYYLTERLTKKPNEVILNKYITNSFDDAFHEKVYQRLVDKLLDVQDNVYQKGHNDEKDITLDDLYNMGQQYIDNYVKYGTFTWYRWRINNWGTKWNACDTTWDDKYSDTVWFNTAWSVPEPIVKKISEMYPNVKFRLDYAEEQVALMTGYVVYQAGECLEDIQYQEDSKEAYEKYFELWGEDEYYTYDESIGNYVYNDPYENQEGTEDNASDSNQLS